MRTLGNILWLILAGLWMGFAYFITGIVMCVLIITIPFGIQAFKLGGYALWPFGRVVVRQPESKPALGCVGNVLWLLLAGLWLAIGHVVTGLLLCLTIIGIPFGVASFKLAGLALVPFGSEVVSLERASEMGLTAVTPAVQPLGGSGSGSSTSAGPQ